MLFRRSAGQPACMCGALSSSAGKLLTRMLLARIGGAGAGLWHQLLQKPGFRQAGVVAQHMQLPGFLSELACMWACAPRLVTFPECQLPHTDLVGWLALAVLRLCSRFSELQWSKNCIRARGCVRDCKCHGAFFGNKRQQLLCSTDSAGLLFS